VRTYLISNAVDVPNLDTHVFFRVVSDVGPYQLDNWARDTLNLNKEDVLAGRYATIKKLLENGEIELI
jgi:hypothetical protein